MASINDEYEKLQIIGQGAFATIWKVRHRKYGYIRTLKILNTPVADENDHAYQQFLKECTVLLNIGNGSNNNIVHIYQPRLIDNRAVVEMDYIAGETLDQYLKRVRFMPIDEVMRFIGDIGGALAYCHHDIYKFMMNPNEDDLVNDPNNGQRYIIDEATKRRLVKKYAVTHNDLHSNNVMRRENDGSYVLLDFGLAIQNGKAVKSSALRGGALEYMSPEKFEDNSVITTQSDIYSFGILMYEALAGRVPFVLGQDASFSGQTLLYRQHKTAIPPSIEALRREAFEAANPGQAYKKDYPNWLEDMILKCLAKNPADRYADAKELMNEFKKCVVASTGSATDDVPPATPTNLIACPDCGKMISKKASACPHCGRPMRKITSILTPRKQRKTSTDGYVDLGLSSCTLWRGENENDFYDYDGAGNAFGNKLPTLKQWRELINECTWLWDPSNKGYKVVGPNGNSIILPAGGRNYGGYVDGVGSYGYYWSSTPYGSSAWGLYFKWNSVEMTSRGQRSRESVRLVQASHSYKPKPKKRKGWLIGGILALVAIIGVVFVLIWQKNKEIIEYETFTANGVSFNMIKVQGGTFRMGCTPEQDDTEDNIDLILEKGQEFFTFACENGNEFDYGSPVHSVTISNYYIGETEVTQELWEAVMGSVPTYDGGWTNEYGQGNNYPAYRISWDDCQEFITRLNSITGQNFRLPTEAEWEYAARGGRKSQGYKYSGSNTLNDVAWYDDNSGGKTHPIKTKSSNELGIYDMNGNVWEWCQDWYGNYSGSSQTNSIGPSTGSSRVFRGGSFISARWWFLVSLRCSSFPDRRESSLGFRLALDGAERDTIHLAKVQKGYVDLGLPSGTLWKDENEKNPKDDHGFYTHDDAVSKFGKQLPTKSQFDELKNKCTWTWIASKKGYKVVGPNGNNIFLPALGGRGCYGPLFGVDYSGHYWSSQLYDNGSAWILYFKKNEVSILYNVICGGQSVRLVQNP